MRAIIMAAAIAAAASPAMAATADDITTTVQQYGHAVIVGDVKGAVALCASPAFVIDDFPPHAWQGPTACADWQAALNKMLKTAGMTDGRVVIGKASRLRITGDVAYGVYPVVFSFNRKGKPLVDQGDWTFVLKRAGGAWRISAWAFAGR